MSCALHSFYKSSNGLSSMPGYRGCQPSWRDWLGLPSTSVMNAQRQTYHLFIYQPFCCFLYFPMDPCAHAGQHHTSEATWLRSHWFRACNGSGCATLMSDQLSTRCVPFFMEELQELPVHVVHCDVDRRLLEDVICIAKVHHLT